MASHRIIWKITGTVAILALVLVGVREVRNAMSRQEAELSMVAVRDMLTQDMLDKLERDPRVRRPATRRLVEIVSTFSASRNRETAESHYALGLLRFYGEMDFAGAEDAHLRATQLRPEWAWPHNGLGIVRHSLGDAKESLESFERAMELDPTWSRPHSDMAILHRLAGNMDAAVVEATRALELDPEGPVTHYNYAVILDVLGKYDEARTIYEKVIQTDPELPAPYYNLACGYARRGDLERALPLLRTSIAMDPAFREEAKKDPDFDLLRDEEAFKRIVEMMGEGSKR